MMEDWTGDQREEHHKQPPEYVDLDTLYKLTFVECFQVYNTVISHKKCNIISNFLILDLI